MAKDSVTSEEDRVLRIWTPRILRTTLVMSTVVLIAGMVAMATQAPGYYVARYHAVQHGQIHENEGWSQLVQGAHRGDPHAIMTIGLYILTLVPLARVAFTFFLFLKERDYIFVAATAYVLAGLIFGVMLGRIG